MADLRYIFSIFSLAKKRSALDTVTGNTVNNAHAVVRSGTEDRIPELLINLSKSSMDSELSSDFRVEFAPK